jgi:hypothetical protein
MTQKLQCELPKIVAFGISDAYFCLKIANPEPRITQFPVFGITRNETVRWLIKILLNG